MDFIKPIMLIEDIQFIELSHQSPELDAAYDIISNDIPPEYLETREFLKNRLRVRDKGLISDKEKILVQDGYTLHLIAAMRDSKVLGAVYGHLIANIGPDNRGIGFVTYITVHPENRRQGIGTKLIAALKQRVNEDAVRITGHPIIGMVFEIEEEGKEEIKTTVSKLGAQPLDIVYFQPALRQGYEPEQMNLWYLSLDPKITIEADAKTFRMPTDVVTSIVRNMLVMEYVGPEMKGFDLTSKPYAEFLKSIGTRKEIGFFRRH